MRRATPFRRHCYKAERLMLEEQSMETRHASNPIGAAANRRKRDVPRCCWRTAARCRGGRSINV